MNNSRNYRIKQFKKEEQENDNSWRNIKLKEEEEPKTNKNKISFSKNEDNVVEVLESSEESIDEERLTLADINRMFDKERSKKRIKDFKEELLLNKKRKNNNDYQILDNIIVYDIKKKKLENTFCATVEELNEFLTNCQVTKLSYDNISPYTILKSKISFDPIQWMKSNDIYQRTLTLEDLSLYCKNQIKEKKESNQKNNINKEKEKEKQNIKKKEKFIKIEPNISNFIDKKIHDNFIQLKKIISYKVLYNDTKKWINNFINEISKINIEDIKIEKNIKGKDNKLDIVLDLDNTCIFSFLSNEDNLLVQSKKSIFPKKEVNIISFNYKNNVIYTALIIRKGLKEFIKYIEPLCNFHISTLSYPSYGEEIIKILSEYLGITFIRYKARFENEFTKNIKDLLIQKENTIIFDDNVNIWENKDNENVINTKFFFDEECAMINIAKNEENEKFKYDKNTFLKSYRFFYNKIKDKKKNTNDWKEQFVRECFNIPFYQFKEGNNYDYNKCFTAEYLDSTKLQFNYMKNVIKQIYILKFIYGVDVTIAIKLIRISTLNNMKFNLKYLDYMQRNILTDLVKICGGTIYIGHHREKNEKIYLVISKSFGLNNKKEEIKKDIENNPFYILINEKFILDTYYFMTNLKDNINDPEYIVNKNELLI